MKRCLLPSVFPEKIRTQTLFPQIFLSDSLQIGMKYRVKSTGAPVDTN